jgi:signal transduction histidine kinase
MSRSDATLGGLAAGADPGSRVDLRDPAKWFFAMIARLFDAISIELLDHWPNELTVFAVVSLLVIAQVSAILVLWSLGLSHDGRIVLGTVTFTSALVGAPIVGFGQMQYRRARGAFLASERLSAALAAARDAAEQADGEKSRFLASMSHELRTPLNAIIGFSEILHEETFGPIGNRKYAEYAGDIHRSGRHLLDLINDVLDLTKIEATQVQIDRSATVNLVSAAAECCETLSVIAAKNKVALSALAESGEMNIRANDRMIRQILLNLTSNAIKFTPEGGRVVVRVAGHDGGAVVQVADTGIGMTEAEARVALQPFGQIDSFQSRKHQGTGLGLSLVKAMLDLHGATLSIESAPGVGTTVSILFPPEHVLRSPAEGVSGDVVGQLPATAMRG